MQESAVSLGAVIRTSVERSAAMVEKKDTRRFRGYSSGGPVILFHTIAAQIKYLSCGVRNS